MVREASGSGTLGSKFDGGGSLSGDADGDGSLSSGSLDGSGDTSGQLSGDSVGSLSGVSNEFLVFDSSGNIVTSGYNSGDFAPATHFHPASDITSGTFDDARISESSVLQYESAINHDNLLNVGVNSHGQIDSHIGDSTIHFTESSIDHNNIQNVGTNTHSQIDSHISDGTIHFTEGSISLTGIGEGIATPSDGDVVIYDGANNEFENRLLVESDIPNLSAGKITSGTFADARISESSVTQHEGAIDHNALFNYNIAEHRTINDSGTGTTDLWSADKINSEFNSLATVASTGNYNDLNNKPDLSALNEISVHADFSSFPATGESDTVYIAEDTGYMYRWNGSSYTQLTDQTAIWGQISGTLSDQTDLQNALDGKSDTSHTHPASDIVSGTFADARISESSVTQHQSALTITESQISDLDHYTSSDFDTDFGNKTTQDLTENVNLYFTDERAQDAVGNILIDTSSISFTYDDATPQITATVLESGVDHNSLSNYAQNEHRVWENSITQNIHEDNITELSVTQHESALTIDASTQLNNQVPYANLPISSTDVSNWNTAYDERGSQIAGTNLTWNGTQLDATDTNTQLNVGAENQIPFVNSSGSDLEYSSDLRWDDTSLLVGGNVDVSNKIILAPITNPTYAEGQLWYSADTTTLSFQNDRSGVTLNIGEETWLRVRNESGSDISNGEAVYINGFSTGAGFPTVELAQADSATTADMVGLATEDIPDNASGMITTYGLVREVDTSAYSAGDTLYLSSSTPGALTTTEPSSPNFSVRVGKVSRSNVGGGQILVGVSDIREAIYTQGSIPYADANGRLIDDNTNLSWDGTDIFVGGNSVWHAGDFSSTDISNWNTAYSERGSQIDGTLLDWNGTQLDVQESSIDHDNLTNTHNLTTDIDHNQLTNYNANEHRVWENSITQNIHEDNITQASITQHESALTITESQITDGSILARVGSDETITGSWTFDDGSAVPLRLERSGQSHEMLLIMSSANHTEIWNNISGPDAQSKLRLNGDDGELYVARDAGGDSTFRKLWHEADFDNPFPNGGDQAVGSSDNVDFNNGNFAGDVVITGDLTVNGTEFITNTETVEIEDNLAILNSGESGSGISAGFAGWEADRGTLTNYQWGFDETRDLWVIGEKGTTLQAVATREDSPTNNALAYWDDTNTRYETDSNLTWDGTDLSIGGSNAIVVGDNVSDLNNDGEYVPKSGGEFTGAIAFDGDGQDSEVISLVRSNISDRYITISVGGNATNYIYRDTDGSILSTLRQETDGKLYTRIGTGTFNEIWHDGNVSTGSNIDITGRTISLTGTIPYGNLPISSTDTSNWNTAYAERGSQIAGTNLSWDGSQLNATDTDTTYTDGTGLDLSGTTFSLSINTLTSLGASPASDDLIAIYDSSASDHKEISYSELESGLTITEGQITGANFSNWNTAYNQRGSVIDGNALNWNGNALDVQEGNISHSNISDVVANEHIDHSSVSITSGTGLSGGGDLTTSRTLSVDINSSTSLGSSVVGSDEILVSDASDSDTIKKTTAQDIADLASGGSPAGSSGEIQFNDSGSFGASSNLYWDSSNNRLGIGTSSPLAPIEIKGGPGSNFSYLHIDTDGSGIPIMFSENGSERGKVDYNYGSNGFAFTVVDSNGSSKNDAFFIRGEQDATEVGVNTQTPNYTFDVDGELNANTLYYNGQDTDNRYLTGVTPSDLTATNSPSTGQVPSYDSAGNFEWIEAGSPAGSNYQIQFNDGGDFGATGQLHYDYLNNFFGAGLASGNVHSTIHSGGSFALGETYSPDITEGDNAVPLDETVGFLKINNQNSGVDVFINLPNASNVLGRVYFISVENPNGGKIVLNAGSSSINGSSSVTLNNLIDYRLHKVFPVVAGVTSGGYGWSV